MKRSKSSRAWLSRHFSDPYVKKAQQEGWRSRAAFKLLELHAKDKIVQSGMTVVDLGAAPGGWSQVVAQLLKGKGNVVALDILPMDALEGVTFLQGDFREEAVFTEFLGLLKGELVDVVLSDMAPNMSGQKAVDQPRVMYLAELALDFALKTLKPSGRFLVKIFQGEGFDEYLKNLRHYFQKVTIRKPDSSRDESREVYLVCQGLKADVQKR